MNFSKTSLFLLSYFIFYSIYSQERSINRGKKIYDNMCFACHGKDLEGATGHNLKDSTWVHGGSKDQIMKSIKNGFPQKGMLAFGAIYNYQQIEDLTNFILSRQEGLRSIEYKIFHGATLKTGVNWEEQKSNKSGSLVPPLINLNIPEVDQSAIHFKGKLLIPQYAAGNFKLSGFAKQSEGLELWINGLKIDLKIPVEKMFFKDITLNAGLHDIELRYIKNDESPYLRLLLSGKINIPLTVISYRRSVSNKLILEAKDSFLISRKRVKSLPPGSILVTHQDKINYSINPHNAAINAVWKDGTLDVGPNIHHRGQHPTVLLGKQLMNINDKIELLIDGSSQKLRFLGYSDKPVPKFMYRINSSEIHISSFLSNDGLVINYYIPSKNTVNFKLKLPQGLKIKIPNGEIKDNIYTPKDSNSFQITIPMHEDIK